MTPSAALGVGLVAYAAWLIFGRMPNQLPPALPEPLPDRSWSPPDWSPPTWSSWASSSTDAALDPPAWIAPSLDDPAPADIAAAPEIESQAAGVWESAALAVTDAAAAIPQALGLQPTPSADQVARNRRAMLDAIAWAEGTAKGPDNGYRVLFGWPSPDRVFTDYADHPRRLFPFVDKAGRRLQTSAAGRYQFIRATWDDVRARLALPDFSPASQDAAAIELIRQKGALRDVDAGRFAQAVDKIRSVWASLPGAGYDQPERKLADLQAAYQAAGGTLEA